MKTQDGTARIGQVEQGGPGDNQTPLVFVRSRSINALESLKQQLLAETLAVATDADLDRRLRRAADEAASLAWATAYPLLALPELLAEKGREAKRQFERQRAIQSRRHGLHRLAA